MITKTCQHCGKEFQSYASNHRLYCSHRCAQTANNSARSKEKEQRECPVCNNLFDVTIYRTKYCSRKCSGIGRRKPESEKFIYIPKLPKVTHCAVCGKEIISLRKPAKYCPVCREARASFKQHQYQQAEKYKEAHRRRARQWQESNKEKYKAAQLVASHPDRINILYECSCEATEKHHHHYNYSKIYDVVLLCDACHAAEHKRLRSLATAQAVNQ